MADISKLKIEDIEYGIKDTVAREGSYKEIDWNSETSTLDNFVEEGFYKFKGVSGDKNFSRLPISSETNFDARLDVIKLSDEIISQLIYIVSNEGCGSYCRQQKNESWGVWEKFQTSINVGTVDNVDNLKIDGTYYGYLSEQGKFILQTISHDIYAAQLLYVLDNNGSYSEVKKRKGHTENSRWSWEDWVDLESSGIVENNDLIYGNSRRWEYDPDHDYIAKDDKGLDTIIKTGIYSGLYSSNIEDPSASSVSIDSFTLFVMNNQDALNNTVPDNTGGIVSQVIFLTNTETNNQSIKMRVCTINDDETYTWSEWGGLLGNDYYKKSEIDSAFVKSSGSKTISGETIFNNDININSKTKILSNIDSGELKVFYNGKSKGFTLRVDKDSIDTLAIPQLQLLATNNIKSHKYIFPELTNDMDETKYICVESNKGELASFLSKLKTEFGTEDLDTIVSKLASLK